MTVAELIELLRCADPDAVVLTDGYEGGYTHPVVEQGTFRRDMAKTDNYVGEFCSEKDPARVEFSAVVVGRKPIFYLWG